MPLFPSARQFSICRACWSRCFWCRRSFTRQGAQFAVKKVRRAFANMEECKRIHREIELLHQCRHDNILQLVDVYQAEGDIYLVTPLMDTSLNRVMRSLTGAHQRHLLRQLLCGLVYLHARSVMHWDLKPDNLLVNKDGMLRI